MYDLHPVKIDPIIKNALAEDWGFVDWSTDSCVPQGRKAKAKILVKSSNLTLAGLDVAKRVFFLVDQDLSLNQKYSDGMEVKNGQVILEISGAGRSILKGERVALNFLGHMCAVATFTKAMTKRLEGTKTRLLDTRKVLPGMRLFDKYAVSVAGALNHRFSLSDGVLIKENHIRAAGGIKKAMESVLGKIPPGLKIEVEVTSLDEVKEALASGADIIMLDNMSLVDMKKAVGLVSGRALLEASGNVTIDNIRSIAETGVDFISSGALTHSAPMADLSLLFDF